MAETLRQAAGEGRLDLEELDERLEATYAAKTYADLLPITADLPVMPGAGQPPSARSVAPRQPWRPPVVVPAYSSSFALLSETKRTGVWQLGAEHAAFAFLGSVTLDLRYARFTRQHVTLTANTVLGGVDILVNPFTHVVVEGIGVMGSFGEGRAKVHPQLGPESPVVLVRGLALLGAVEVKRKAARG